MKKNVDFSIIIPIYNVEKYLFECLDSIKKQTYDNYEVIMIDDESTDNSIQVANKFLADGRFNLYKTKHSGVSETRNFGVSVAKGKYLLFIDSDDTINKDLLKELYKIIEKNNEVNIIRYGVSIIQNNEVSKTKFNTYQYNNSVCAFDLLLGSEVLDAACICAINRKFYLDNNFYFSKGRLHEDFGLIPYILLKSKSSCSISYYGYNYYKRINSITTSSSNIKKRVYDKLYFYDNYMKMINKEKLKNSSVTIFKSYIANAIINAAKVLSGKELDKYICELKKRKVYDNLLKNTIGRYLKYLAIKYFLSIYIHQKKGN